MAGSSAGDRRILLAIVLIAFALRLAYVIDAGGSIYSEHPTLDSFWYDAKAQETLKGDAGEMPRVARIRLLPEQAPRRRSAE